MKRTVILILTLVMISSFLFAAAEKVAILELKKQDRKSDYIVKMLLKRDFNKLFEQYDNLQLIDLKDTEEMIEESGYTNISALGSERLAKLGQKLDADYLVWGTVQEQGSNEFKISVRIYSMRSGSVTALNFNTEKNTDSRRENVKNNLMNRLERLISTELQEAINIAQQHFNSRNYTAAQDAFQRVVEIDKTNVMAHFYLGYINYFNRNYEKAEEYYLQALELDPQNTDILQQLSKTYLQQFKYEEAVDILHKLAEIQESKETWLQIGDTYTKIEYYEDAADAYRKAIELDTDYAEAYKQLGLMYYDQELYDKAIQPLEEAVKRFPDDEQLSKKLGKCYLRTGKLDSAIEQYKSLIAEQPQNTRAYMNLANAYSTLNNYQKAAETLNKLKEMEPENIKIYTSLAEAYISLKNYDAAEKNAKIAIEKDPSNYKPYLTLAKMYQQIGYKKYENYLSLEEKAKEAYGAEADKLVQQRDSQRDAANSDFTTALDYLQKTKDRTDSNSALREIASRKKLLNQLLEATKSSFF
jgi:tetratricopeptide (TPR) repeat protein